MSWGDAAQLETRLKLALNSFDWPEVDKICPEIIERVKSDPELLPQDTAKTFLRDLRGQRRFKWMTELAEAFLQSGLRTPQIRRQYAQALIDQGLLAAPEMILQSVVQDAKGQGEEFEARGLIGRLYKQLYVNNNDPTSPRNRANLERALNEYLYVYRLDPGKVWHGINVVALIERARRDNVSLAGLPDAAAMAQEILNTIQKRDDEGTERLPAWDVGTRLEAHVALGNHQEAANTALRYIEWPGGDAFEIASTLRQFIQVWQLTYTELPGSQLLPILKAGHLKKEGAAMEGDPRKLREEAAAAGKAIKGLEGIFGDDRMLPLKWYKKGLEQCDGVAQVQKPNGKGHGTGWLVQASDFFSNRSGLLLLTNGHVVSDNPNPFSNPKAIYPEDARIKFEGHGEDLYEVQELVWTSPPDEFDATFLALKTVPEKAVPLTIHTRAVNWVKPAAAPRFYIIGHPGGRDLEISLQDNHLIAYNNKLLHYRTPTEPGSSGSPVFEPDDWRVVALHHRGDEEMERLDGESGTYEANEGISILAIQNATRG
jgi:V8-like Glu-specific endopeptidase